MSCIQYTVCIILNVRLFYCNLTALIGRVLIDCFIREYIDNILHVVSPIYYRHVNTGAYRQSLSILAQNRLVNK